MRCADQPLVGEAEQMNMTTESTLMARQSRFGFAASETNSVLAISPHPDDVELGCFGSLAAYAGHGYQVHILVMTDGGRGGDPEKRKKECLESAALIDAVVHFSGIRDCQLTESVETIDKVETLLRIVKPQIVFGPSGKDTHQDHRNAALAMISATRRFPDQVFAYQTPSTTVDYTPTCYFDVTDYHHIKEKAVRIHASQSERYYTAGRAMETLANYRGLRMGNAERYLEAFEVIRLVHRWQ
jgi:LmbE family N-acetylglucosaminyl deacetylase